MRRVNGSRSNGIRLIMELESQCRAGVGGTDAVNTNAAINALMDALAMKPSGCLTVIYNKGGKGTDHMPYHR